ncbi:MAG: hypothetical protein H6R14_554 [Proteobacteria bacterium]|nr:hypothetical protein [Pseudomonadota bacterium]
MAISSILLSGMQSLQSSVNRTSIAGSALNVEAGDFASRMVAMRQGEIEAKAAADVIKTGDQMLGSILDIRG